MINCEDVIFDPQPLSQDIRDGESASLRCGMASNAQRYRISWLFAGNPVRDDHRRYHGSFFSAELLKYAIQLTSSFNIFVVILSTLLMIVRPLALLPLLSL